MVSCCSTLHPAAASGGDPIVAREWDACCFDSITSEQWPVDVVVYCKAAKRWPAAILKRSDAGCVLRERDGCGREMQDP